MEERFDKKIINRKVKFLNKYFAKYSGVTTSLQMDEQGEVGVLPEQNYLFPDGNINWSCTALSGLTNTFHKNLGGREGWKEIELQAVGNALLDWLEEDQDRIFYEEFLLEFDLYGEFISQQSKVSNAFSQNIKKAERIKEVRINNKALNGQKNPVYAIFYQKSKQGYIDRPAEQQQQKQLPVQIIVMPNQQLPGSTVDYVELQQNQNKIEQGRTPADTTDQQHEATEGTEETNLE